MDIRFFHSSVVTLYISVFLYFVIVGNAGAGNSKQMPVKVVLKPFKEVYLSSNVPAKVKEYKVEEGERVKAGQLLVVLDNRSYYQIHRESEAIFEEAKAEKEYTEDDYKRKVQLFQKGYSGRSAVEKSKRDAAVALSKYQRALAVLRRTELDLNSCLIKAPFSGRVMKKITHVHENAKSGDPILQLVDDHKLYAVIHFPSSAIHRIKIGEKLKVKISEADKVYPVTVSEKSANIDPGSRTFEVRALLENTDDNLRAGMSGHLVK